MSCLGFAGYFAVHTLHGRHGLEARDRLIDRAMVNEHQIGGLETAIEALSADVAALDQTPPDDDAVVSFARKQLGYGYPDEQVYRLPDAAARP
ncbi:MAG: septum formation initiator family protein [Pseudomonadota bacterium]